MPEHETNLAIFPGMFDPVTLGHLDIIQRASKLFDRLLLAIGLNPLKTEVFTLYSFCYKSVSPQYSQLKIQFPLHIPCTGIRSLPVPCCWH